MPDLIHIPSSNGHPIPGTFPAINDNFDTLSNASASLDSDKADKITVIAAGTGLTGGGDLSADRSFALNAASIASLLLADSAVQPGDLADVAFSGLFSDLTDDVGYATDAELAAAISALSSVYQPLDADLTAIAALTTTTYGRGFLNLADNAALATKIAAIAPLWTGNHRFLSLWGFGNLAAPTDEKNWIAYVATANGQFNIVTANDASPLGGVKAGFRIQRSSTAVTGMLYGNSTDNPSHTFYGLIVAPSLYANTGGSGLRTLQIDSSGNIYAN